MIYLVLTAWWVVYYFATAHLDNPHKEVRVVSQVAVYSMGYVSVLLGYFYAESVLAFVLYSMALMFVHYLFNNIWRGTFALLTILVVCLIKFY